MNRLEWKTVATKTKTPAVKAAMICFACWNDETTPINLPLSPRIENYGNDLIYKLARTPATMTRGAL